jgi:hypothetical protein
MEEPMNESNLDKTVKKPWHLWLVGIVGLLWSAMGAMDYVMTQTENEAYMSKFTQAQLDFFYGLPALIISAWAIAVWAGVLGCVFLLMKKGTAVPLLLVSLIAMVITAVHNYGISNGLEVIGGTFELVFTAIIFLVALGLYLYARAMKQKGVLK